MPVLNSAQTEVQERALASAVRTEEPVAQAKMGTACILMYSLQSVSLWSALWMFCMPLLPKWAIENNVLLPRPRLGAASMAWPVHALQGMLLKRPEG